MLSNSVSYKRVVGYFSSQYLSRATRGLVKFIENGGKAQMICGIDISPEDVEAIRNGYKERDKLIERKILEELKRVDVLYVKSSLQILGWMVKYGTLDIKIAVKKTYESGIFHPKFGLCYDAPGNVVAFEGSSNETVGGLIENREAISVDVSWDTSSRIQQRIKMMEEEFDQLWQSNDDEYFVIELPDTAKQELKAHAPSSRPTKEPFSISMQDFNPQLLKPWLCQARAVVTAKENKFKGILKMATGTGKTSCALFILKKFFDEIKNNGNRIVILVPSGKDGIGGQWESFLRKNVSSKDYVFRYDSESSADEKSFENTSLPISLLTEDLHRFVRVHLAFRDKSFAGLHPCAVFAVL